jgi:hypothetical protein
MQLLPLLILLLFSVLPYFFQTVIYNFNIFYKLIFLLPFRNHTTNFTSMKSITRK